MRILTFVLAASILCTFSSCQKDPDSGDSSAVFTATIDGTPFNGNQLAMATRALNTIAIAGRSADGEQILLRVADSGIHVYSLEINSFTNVGAYSKNDDYAFATNQGEDASQSSGILSISSIDANKKTMSGTFSMKVYRAMDDTQKTITEGTFKNLSYEEDPVPPAGALDTFRIKADGVQFPVYSITGISAYNMISISASNQSVSNTVGISFPSNITAGTYNFTFLGPTYIAQYNTGESYLIGNSGTLTILEHNTTKKRIRGNFNFDASEITGSPSATLTDGYFSVLYQ
jgi:hypothetical protein